MISLNNRRRLERLERQALRRTQEEKIKDSCFISFLPLVPGTKIPPGGRVVKDFFCEGNYENMEGGRHFVGRGYERVTLDPNDFGHFFDVDEHPPGRMRALHAQSQPRPWPTCRVVAAVDTRH